MWPVFHAFMHTPRFSPVKGFGGFEYQEHLPNRKKPLRNIDTKKNYLNGAFENGTITVYDEAGFDDEDIQFLSLV